MHYENDMVLFRKKIKELVDDAELVDSICAVYEQIHKLVKEERRIRQQEGIRRAKEEGKKLGRPKLKEPEGFREVVQLWSQKRMNVHDAAKLCGMGVSTFYRRINALRAAAEREGGEGNEAAKK